MRTYKQLIVILLTICSNISFVNAQTYCIPNPTNGTTANIYIDGVQLGDINMTGTGANPGPNYNDYTYYTTGLKRGSSYSLTLTGSPYYSNMHYVAWIDYNQDGDFLDVNEKLGEYTTTLASQKFTLNFNVPVLALLNKTRLRVRAVWNITNPDPCINYSYGETEDYSVVINDFNKINTGIKGMYGQITSANFDNDGDLDFFLMDEYFNDTIQFCYKDNGPGYSFYNLMPNNLPLLYSPTYNFADLNNDNYLDGLFTGRDRTTEKPVTMLYRNNGSTLNVFTSKITPLKGGTTACADLNNDGRKDIIITGQDINNKYYTYIYQNYIDSFKLVPIETLMPGLLNGKIKCIDYDNDIDIDIFMSGYDKYGNRNSIIYRNDGDWNFTNINAKIDKISSEFVEWGDMNNDGKTDLVMDRYEGLKIYLNQGNDQFTEVQTNIEALECGIALGDFNNDGFLDIISQSADITTVYINSGSNTFPTFIQGYVKGTTDPDIKGFEIGDYNLDNKLDIAVNGDYVTILENTNSTSNKIPNTPTVLSSTTHYPDYYSVSLNWNAVSDDHTPSIALTYNLKVGTYIGGNNIMSSETVMDTVLLQTSNGNVGHNTSWIIKNLAPGTYYWQVQAIDNAYNASSFSSYRSFVILPPISQANYQFEGIMLNQFPGFDFDGDNDMDVIIKKDTVKIYEQISPGNFTSRNIGYGISVLGLSDLNKDNLPEIIFGKPDTLGYYLKNADKSFTPNVIDTISTSAVTSADFDNDGDVDILAVQGGIYLYECTGISNYLPVYKKRLIYNTDTFATFIYITSQDLDLDGDIDFLISGPVSSSYNAKSKTITFLNKGNLYFEKYQDIYPGLGPLYFATGSFTTYMATQSISLNNYNADPYPDLFITGRDDFQNNNTLIYLNDSSGKFKLLETGIRPTNKNTASWFDFNVDGYVDAIMPLMNSDDCVINLNYKNQYYYPFSSQIDTVAKGWFINHLNMDKDRDEDILISKAVKVTGPMGLFKFFTKVFINNGNLINSEPSAPTKDSLSVVQDGFDIILKWNKGSDRQQDKNGLTYNLWVGTSIKSPNILSPMSDLSTGYNYYPKQGNVGGNLSWRLKNLQPGTYYWSVQAIDNSYQGSKWAIIDTFVVNQVNIDFTCTKPCAGQNITFTNLTTSARFPIIGYTWKYSTGEFVDVVFSKLKDPTVTFKTPGKYKITLEVSLLKSRIISTYSKDTTVLPTPFALFNVPPTCLGSVTQFKNLSDTTNMHVKSWLWDFGNGVTSKTRGNVTQAYIKTDTASLQIESTDGCIGTFTQTAIIGTYPVSKLYLEDGNSKSLCMGDSSKIFIDPDPSLNYNWYKDSSLIINQDANKYYVKHSGRYSVAAIDPISNCFTMSESINFTESELPAVPDIGFFLGDSIKCPYDSIVIGIHNLNTSYSYNWYKNSSSYKEKETKLSGDLGNGEYYVKASIGSCISESRKINIFNKTAPAKPQIFSNNGPDIYYLTCNNTKASAYHWYYNDLLINQANKYYLVAGKKLGKYYVELEEPGKDCAARSNEIVLAKSANAQVENNDLIIIHPNPSNGSFKISFSNPDEIKAHTIKVVKLTGEVIYQSEINNNESEHDVTINSFKTGVYIVKIATTNNEISRLIILQ